MGCRKYRGRQYYDDLSGQTHLPEDLEEIAFVFDGKAKVIHLDRKNAAAFREAMRPYVDVAEDAPKSKILATLPKKTRHLTVVPDVPPSPDPEPEGSDQNTPSEEKGNAVEGRTEPEGTPAPEVHPDVSDSSPPEPAPRPALTVVPSPDVIPPEWATWAPRARDDQPTKVKKVRAWATALGRPQHEVLTPQVFERWEVFYGERHWLNL